jgi:hypothetical protein
VEWAPAEQLKAGHEMRSNPPPFFGAAVFGKASSSVVLLGILPIL